LIGGLAPVVVIVSCCKEPSPLLCTWKLIPCCVRIW
jgi:hypothetical protein